MAARSALAKGWIASAIILPIACIAWAQDKGPCSTALSKGLVCEAVNQQALEIIKDLEAIIVMQDVQTGGLIAFAASDPAKLYVTTALLPRSPVKLMAAASWLEH